MNRKQTMFLVGLSILIGLPSAFGQESADAARSSGKSNSPNILFLFADDQRCDTIGAYGNERIQTPNLDRLSRQAMNFRNAYCFGSPHGAVCVASRAMLHSGRSLFHLNSLELEGHQTLGEILGQSGYQTFATGKWHNGSKSFARSFQAGRNIMLGGMSNHLEVPLVQFNGQSGNFSKPSTGPEFSSDLFADAAVEFLKSQDDERPFFCYVAFTAPHDPRMAPEPFNRMYQPEKLEVPKNFLPQHPFDQGDLTVRDENLAPWPRTREVIQSQTAEYYGLISHLDEQVGRILTALKESGKLENTIVIYSADHGLAMGSHGLLGKQSLYEHSMKAPLMVAGPGIKNGTDESLVYLHDLFPTILQYAKIEFPENTDGRSLMPLIEQAESFNHRDFLFTSYKSSIRAIRDKRWKLIRYPQVDQTQMFDLLADRDEMNNLVDSPDPEHKAIKARLLNELMVAQKESGDDQSLVVPNPRKSEIDLSGHPRKPDEWQPAWIVEKYFDRKEADKGAGKRAGKRAGKVQDSETPDK